MSASTNQTSTNRRIARPALIIGSIALLIAFMAFIFQRDITLLVVLSAVTAMIGLGVWMTLAPDELRELLQGRQTRYGTGSILISVLLFGIAVLLYSIASGTGVAVDLTSVGYYTLKQDVRPVVENLPRPIVITAFYTSRDLGRLSADTPILRLFADAAPDRVLLNIVDPNQEPILARAFNVQTTPAIYISFAMPDGTPDTTVPSIRVAGDDTSAFEPWIAEAILRLNTRGSIKVLFTIGHNELSTENGAVNIRSILESDGVSVSTIDLRNEDIPGDTNALVMLAPQSDFTADEVQKVAQYVANGGRLFIMAEPAYTSDITFAVADDSPMLTYLRDNWGVVPGRDIVIDPASSAQDTTFYVLPASYNDLDPMLDVDTNSPGVQGVQPLLLITQSLQIVENSPQDVVISRLYESSDESFSRNAPDAARDAAFGNLTQVPTDRTGPLILAIAAQNTRSSGRLVLIGDVDWVLDDQIGLFNGEVLWRNAMNFLTNYLEEISVNARAVALPMSVTANELNLAALITLVIIPGLVLFAGLVMWVVRSRK
jgi:hypothetical protein